MMTVQTDKDPRLLAAQLAIDKLKNSIFSKSTVRPNLNRDRTNVIISELDSTLMSLKFSYMPPTEMADSQLVKDIFENSKKLYIGHKEAIDSGFSGLPRANLLWAFGVLSGLSRRLKNSGDKSTHGIDIVAVAIRNITKNEELNTTRCIAGPTEFTIVTNIPNLKAGDTLAAAILPPAIVGGIVSGAMFLGSEIVEMQPGTFLDPSVLNTKEADGILYSEIGSLKW